MTTISSKVIEDSFFRVGGHYFPIKSVQLRYPRCIHSELMTHRAFSRNASSSRAIPVAKLIKDVMDDPYIPLHWGKNQPGMQAHEQHDAEVQVGYNYGPLTASEWTNPVFPTYASNVDAWLKARDNAVEMAYFFDKAGYHKQIVNRLLEPFAHINVLVTATEWDNFFELRDHPDAEPHIRLLARCIKDSFLASKPKELKFGDWHLPYITEEDRMSVLRDCNRDVICSYSKNTALTYDDVLRGCSVARCARVSYMTQEGAKPSVEKDLELYNKLVGSKPLHASPAEHQATPDEWCDIFTATELPERGKKPGWQNRNLHGNFYGWKQYRKMLED